MKATEKVLNFLKKNANKQLDTSEIAKQLQLSRSVVSGYLAQLYQRQLVEKTKGRPVYWHVVRQQSAFQKLIGYNGSLRKCIEQAKQSIVYPPNGFPVIITGPSGVGKSVLARLIYEEAVRLKVIKQSSPFVVLNTADYANNTELLSSVLFGYKKGAFTGAEKDTPGLIDKADGGYLFLDEVHRLSKTNQEKLFSLLDNGTFYPLGEVDHPHHVNVRLICATTEDLNKYLLKTFLRRIPLKINIPQFIDRPPLERVHTVTSIFKNEARQTNVTYAVSEREIDNLINQDYLGNLGTLQNKIKMLCSQGYAANTGHRVIPIGLIHDKNQVIVHINKNTRIHKLNFVQKRVAATLQTMVGQVIDSLQKNNDLSDAKLIIFQYLRKIREYADPYYVKVFKNKLIASERNILQKSYGIDLRSNAEEIESLAIFLSLARTYSLSLRNIEELIKIIKINYSRSFYLFNIFLEHFKSIKNSLNKYILFPPIFANVAKKIEEINYTCILLAHGESTAKSIQGVINNLLRNYIFEAFDMPIDASVDDINKQVKDYLKKQNHIGKGIILLFDMGSLNQMFTKIKKGSDKELLVVNNLTTATALDIALRVQRGESFKQIAKKASKYGKYMGVQYYKGLSDKKNIIVSCLSGVGLSEAIRDIMVNTLSKQEKIITMDYRDLHSLIDHNDRDFFKNTDLIITTTDFKSSLDLPIVNIYNILDKDGFSNLQMYLLKMGEKTQDVKKLLNKFLSFLTIQGVKDRLQILNPNMVINEVQKVTQKYEDYYNVEFSGKIKLNLYMHLSIMFERILLNPIKNDGFELLTDQRGKEFYSVSRTIFKPVEMKFHFHVNDVEISLIYELLKNYI